MPGWFPSFPVAVAIASSTSDSLVGKSAPDNVLILVNPRSFRISLRGRMPRIAAVARAHGQVLHEVSRADEIQAAVHEGLKRRVRLIVVIGGDGTLQAVVSTLACRCSEDELPQLLMLAGGRTNYTARDLGSNEYLVDTLQLALGSPDSLRTTVRHSLSIRHPDLPEQHGFFIAGGLVDHVIRDCHTYRHGGSGPLRQGHFSSAFRVIQIGLLGLVGRSSYNPPRLEIQAKGLGSLKAPVRLLLLTSLHHRSELVDPYATRGKGPLRLTAIAMGAPGFWRRLPGVIRGRFSSTMSPANGYLSGATDQVCIAGLSRVSLDGQEFDFDPAHPVLVCSGPAFRFLHP